MRVKAGLMVMNWCAQSSTATASFMLRITSPAMRCSYSALRLAVMSRAVPAMRTGWPSASRSTTRPRARTHTHVPLPCMSMRCSEVKMGALPCRCRRRRSITSGRSSSWMVGTSPWRVSTVMSEVCTAVSSARMRYSRRCTRS